jgi:hypothetical protein
MRPTRLIALAAPLLILLASCREAEPDRPQRPAVLIFTPKVPGSILLDTTGTDEAEHITLVVPVSGDSAAAYFRRALPDWGWEIEGDRSAGDAIDLYARKGPTGRSTLWIHIERQDSLSARYSMIATTPPGAIDSAAARLPEPAPVPAPERRRAAQP